MRVLQLNSEFEAQLLAQPESGMGFQIVEIGRAYAQNEEAWIVFNSELAIAFDNSYEASQWADRQRAATSLNALTWNAAKLEGFYREPRVVMTRSGVGLKTSSYGAASGAAPTPLSLVKQSVTAANAEYRRFSAFRSDKRVDPLTGSYRPGTYATTIADEAAVPSGFAAVGRYALPNVMPSSFVHYATSPAGVVVHSGTVAPAYGQSGGGVEVFFPNGLRNTKPKVAPRQLPDE